VESLDTYFYASAADEEDTFVTVTAPVVISKTIVQGKVTEVSGDEFVVDAGVRKVRVDVSEMSNDPLDDEGYRKIKVGDRVSVIGKMDDDLFEGRELMAQSVVTLSGG
jgi:ribosomal protein S1